MTFELNPNEAARAIQTRAHGPDRDASCNRDPLIAKLGERKQQAMCPGPEIPTGRAQPAPPGQATQRRVCLPPPREQTCPRAAAPPAHTHASDDPHGVPAHAAGSLRFRTATDAAPVDSAHTPTASRTHAETTPRQDRLRQSARRGGRDTARSRRSGDQTAPQTPADASMTRAQLRYLSRLARTVITYI